MACTKEPSTRPFILADDEIKTIIEVIEQGKDYHTGNYHIKVEEHLNDSSLLIWVLRNSVMANNDVRFPAAGKMLEHRKAFIFLYDSLLPPVPIPEDRLAPNGVSPYFVPDAFSMKMLIMRRGKLLQTEIVLPYFLYMNQPASDSLFYFDDAIY